MKENILSLRLPVETVFLPVAAAFGEKTALAFGLGLEEASALGLAAEEIYLYAGRLARSGAWLEIEASSAVYQARLDFVFPAEMLNLRALNLAARVSLAKGAGLEEMSLLVASRLVDRCLFRREADRRVRLSLVKEKSYPEPAGPPPVETRPLEAYTLRPPDAEELGLVAGLIAGHYPRREYPGRFRCPGRVADMAAGGALSALVAAGPDGRLGGAVFWRWEGEKTVELFGPYLFGQPGGSQAAEALLEGCLEALARTQALALVSRWATPDLPHDYFQVLGALALPVLEGGAALKTAYFRQMHEDPGCRVWTHPDLASFLGAEYDRLVLPREIQTAAGRGEAGGGYSVLSTELDRPQGLAT
ncbi:MAG: hypothetical protein AB1896_21445, partial [Thermodesulfobacteriota bacterium]